MSECKNCASLSERAQNAEKQVHILIDQLERAQALLKEGAEFMKRFQPKEMVIDLHNCNEVAHVFNDEGNRCVCGEKTRQSRKGLPDDINEMAKYQKQPTGETTAQDDNTGLTLFALVAEKMDWGQKKTATWFDTPNPLLGGASPNWMLDRGRHDKLGKFIRACLDENSPPEASTQVAHPVCPKCSTPMELGKCDLWFCPVSGCTASNDQKGGK